MPAESRIRTRTSRSQREGQASIASVTIENGRGAPNTLLAAAQVLASRRISEQPARLRKRTTKEGGAWQSEIWALLDEIGELWFAGAWMSAALSRVRIVAAKQSDDGSEPRILGGWSDDCAQPSEGLDTPPNPCPTPDERIVARLVSRWAGGIAGQEQFLARAAWHLSIAADTYIVARPNLTGDHAATPTDAVAYEEALASDPIFQAQELTASADNWTWMPYSNEELSYVQGGWRVTDGTDATSRLDTNALVIRCWRPHPRRFREAGCATRAALPILRELRGLTMHVSAQIDSRLAGAGLLLLPQSMTFPGGTQTGDATGTEDPFREALMEAMLTPIKDRDSAAAIVPVIAYVPDDTLGKAHYLRFGDTALSAQAKELREEAIHRLSLSLDIPQEIVTGMSDTNHWQAWQIDEAAIKMHVAPLAALLCHALTVGWLIPALEEMGVDNPDDYLVWFDTTALVLRPDRSKDAKELFDRTAIGAKALRRESGFSETDAPGDKERQIELLIRIVERAPTLAPIILPLLGIDVPLSAASQAAETVQGITGIDPANPSAQRANDVREDPIRDARTLSKQERREITTDAQTRGEPLSAGSR